MCWRWCFWFCLLFPYFFSSLHSFFGVFCSQLHIFSSALPSRSKRAFAHSGIAVITSRESSKSALIRNKAIKWKPLVTYVPGCGYHQRWCYNPLVLKQGDATRSKIHHGHNLLYKYDLKDEFYSINWAKDKVYRHFNSRTIVLLLLSFVYIPVYWFFLTLISSLLHINKLWWDECIL